MGISCFICVDLNILRQIVNITVIIVIVNMKL